MKKLLLTLGLMFLTTNVHALNIGDYLKEMAVNQGVIYSLKDSEFSHVSTAELVNKWGASFEAGYSDNGKLVGVVSYKLLSLKDYIETPIINEIEFKPGLYYAWDELDSEPKGDYGISVTMLEITF